jgi:hypothetical protein
VVGRIERAHRGGRRTSRAEHRLVMMSVSSSLATVVVSPASPRRCIATPPTLSTHASGIAGGTAAVQCTRCCCERVYIGRNPGPFSHLISGCGGRSQHPHQSRHTLRRHLLYAAFHHHVLWCCKPLTAALRRCPPPTLAPMRHVCWFTMAAMSALYTQCTTVCVGSRLPCGPHQMWTGQLECAWCSRRAPITRLTSYTANRRSRWLCQTIARV